MSTFINNLWDCAVYRAESCLPSVSCGIWCRCSSPWFSSSRISGTENIYAGTRRTVSWSRIWTENIWPLCCLESKLFLDRTDRSPWPSFAGRTGRTSGSRSEGPSPPAASWPSLSTRGCSGKCPWSLFLWRFWCPFCFWGVSAGPRRFTIPPIQPLPPFSQTSHSNHQQGIFNF